MSHAACKYDTSMSFDDSFDLTDEVSFKLLKIQKYRYTAVNQTLEMTNARVLRISNMR